MNKTIKSIIKIVIALFVFVISFNTRSFGAHCENIVVVIDPGHGGDSLGGNYEDRIERDINLITAFAMRDRLEQYDGVDVYVTRENNTDKEMTRKERFDFAKKVDADFLFSIHYNMSEYHTLFGSEVWIPSKGNNYVLGYQFATVEMKALTELGLFDRGIKNKLDKNKSGEYYGILKYSEEYDIPA
ncbi:MAG: N-acetylmuramoyl-L-alanine amidase, partial [Spirochaetales bacterium]|nr:N-acetylmuramoyl-L-alanine amidase [Spirochaetales bacterium]